MPRSQAKKRQRRGWGESAIYQRADGKWVAAVSLGRDDQGKRIRRVFYAKSESEAKNKVKDQVAREGGILRARPDSGTLSEWMTTWLAEIDHANAPTTAANYRGVWKKHAEPIIGRKRLSTFDSPDVVTLYRQLQAKGVSPAMIAKLRVVLHRAFEVARQRRDFIGDNPFGLVKPPRYTAKEMHALTLPQAQRLIATAQASGDRYEAAVVLAVTCGMRLGEILGLRWDDIEWKGRAIAVRRSVQEVCGRFTISEGKTSTARRKITLGSIALAALKRRKKIAESDEWVFTTTAGTFVGRTALRERSFKPLLRKAKVPTVRFHDLRHSFASLLLQQGVPTKVAAEALGHANPAITTRLYQHTIGDLQQRAIASLDGALAGRAPRKTATKMATRSPRRAGKGTKNPNKIGV